MAKAPRSKAGKRKKVVRKVSSGIAYIKSTFNNTIIAITDPSGAVLSWVSAGMVGFKGAKKSTPYAAQRAASDIAKRVKEMGLKFGDKNNPLLSEYPYDILLSDNAVA